MDDRYVMEDPYGHTRWEANAAPTAFIGPPWRLYRYFERATVSNGKQVALERHSGFREWRDENKQLRRIPMKVETVTKISAEYGYTWRGISREKDRDNGIAGGETVVVNLRSGEILALHRGFVFAETGDRLYPINFESRATCVSTSTGKAEYKSPDTTYRFLSKVLRPILDAQK